MFHCHEPKKPEEEKEQLEEYYKKLEECSFTSISEFRAYLPFLYEVSEKCEVKEKPEHAKSLQTLIDLIARPPLWSSKLGRLKQIKRVIEKLRDSFKHVWNRFLRTEKKNIFKRNQDVLKHVPCSSALSTSFSISKPITTTTLAKTTTSPPPPLPHINFSEDLRIDTGQNRSDYTVSTTITTIECTVSSVSSKMDLDEEISLSDDDTHPSRYPRHHRKHNFNEFNTERGKHRQHYRQRGHQSFYRPFHPSQRSRHPHYRTRFDQPTPYLEHKKKYYDPERWELEESHFRNYYEDELESDQSKRKNYSAEKYSSSSNERRYPRDEYRSVSPGPSRRKRHRYPREEYRSVSPGPSRRKRARLSSTDSRHLEDEDREQVRSQFESSNESRVATSYSRHHEDNWKQDSTIRRRFQASKESRTLSYGSRHEDFDYDSRHEDYDYKPFLKRQYEPRMVADSRHPNDDSDQFPRRKHSTSTETRLVSSDYRRHEDTREVFTKRKFRTINETRLVHYNSPWHHQDEQLKSRKKYDASNEKKLLTHDSQYVEDIYDSFDQKFDRGMDDSDEGRLEICEDEEYERTEEGSFRNDDEVDIPALDMSDDRSASEMSMSDVWLEAKFSKSPTFIKKIKPANDQTEEDVHRCIIRHENMIAKLVHKNKENSLSQYQNIETVSKTSNLSTIHSELVEAKEFNMEKSRKALQKGDKLPDRSNNVSQNEVKTKDQRINRRKMSSENEAKTKDQRIDRRKMSSENRVHSEFKNKSQIDKSKTEELKVTKDRSTCENQDKSQDKVILEKPIDSSNISSNKKALKNVNQNETFAVSSKLVENINVEKEPALSLHETKPAVENQSIFSAILDDAMEPIRLMNKSRSKHTLEHYREQVQKQKDLEQKLTPLLEQKLIPPLPKPVETEVEDFAPIFEKVISAYDKVVKTPIDANRTDKRQEAEVGGLPKVEDDLTSHDGETHNTTCLNTDDSKTPYIMEGSSSLETTNIFNLKDHDEKITKDTPKSLIEMTEEDIIRRPFLTKLRAIPFLNNSDTEPDDEEQDSNKSDKKEEIRTDVFPINTKENVNRLHQSSENEINPTISKSLKSRLFTEISHIHKVGSQYGGGALRGLKSDNMDARRMASLKTGAIIDLQKEEKKPQRVLPKSRNKFPANTNFGSIHSKAPKDNKPSHTTNLAHISHEELKRIVDKNLSLLPNPPNINLINKSNTPVKEMPKSLTAPPQPDLWNSASVFKPVGSMSANIVNIVDITNTEFNQNNQIQQQNTSIGWPTKDPRVGHTVTQFPYTANIADSPVNSSRPTCEANGAYNPPVLQNDPFRSPCYDGSSTPDPYRPDPYTLNLAQNISSNSVLPSPMFDMPNTPLLETPPSPFMQFDSYPSSFIHSSERDNVQVNPLMYSPMLLPENNIVQRPQQMMVPQHMSYDRAHFGQQVVGSPYRIQNNMYRSRTPNSYPAWRLEKYGLRPKFQQRTNQYRWNIPINVTPESENKHMNEDETPKRENDVTKLSARDPRFRSVEEPLKMSNQRDPRRRNGSPPIERGRSIERNSSRDKNLQRRSLSRGRESLKERSRSRSRHMSPKEQNRSRSRNRLPSKERSERYQLREKDGYSSSSDRKKRQDYSPETERSRSKDPCRRSKERNCNKPEPRPFTDQSNTIQTITNLDVKYRIPKINKAETKVAQNVESEVPECGDTNPLDSDITGDTEHGQIDKELAEVSYNELDEGSNQDMVESIKSSQPPEVPLRVSVISDKITHTLDASESLKEITFLDTEKCNPGINKVQSDNEVNRKVPLASDAPVCSINLETLNPESVQDLLSVNQNSDELLPKITTDQKKDHISDKFDESVCTYSSQNEIEKVDMSEHQEENVDSSVGGTASETNAKNSAEKEEIKDNEHAEVTSKSNASAKQNPEPSVPIHELQQIIKGMLGPNAFAEKAASINSFMSFLGYKPDDESGNQTKVDDKMTVASTSAELSLPIQNENLQSAVGKNVADTECDKGTMLTVLKCEGKKRVRGKANSSKEVTNISGPLLKKGKKKNELDKLQDDISNYHDSEAIATASGPRKCRLQKEKAAELEQSVQASQSKKNKKKEILKKNTNPNKSKRSPSPRIDSDSSSDFDSLALYSHKLKAKYGASMLESETIGKKIQGVVLKATIIDSSEKDLANRDTNLNKIVDIPEKSRAEEKDSSLPKGQYIQEDKAPNSQELVCSSHRLSQSLDSEAEIDPSINDNKEDNLYGTNKRLKDNNSDSENVSTHSNTIKRTEKSERIVKKKTVDEPKCASKEGYDKQNEDLSNEGGNVGCDLEESQNLADSTYYQDGDFRAIKCKLCSFKGKHIVSHYTISHPKDEVFISRMSPEVAELAVKESNLFFNTGLAKSTEFTCRFCRQVFFKLIVFFEHLALHSGEYRHECCKCGYRTSTRGGIYKHFHSVHENISKVNCRVLYKEPGDKNHLIGYLCKLCNFFQLSEKNVRRHLISAHDKVDPSYIIKINCSLLNYDHADYDTSKDAEDGLQHFEEMTITNDNSKSEDTEHQLPKEKEGNESEGTEYQLQKEKESRKNIGTVYQLPEEKEVNKSEGTEYQLPEEKELNTSEGAEYQLLKEKESPITNSDEANICKDSNSVNQEIKQNSITSSLSLGSVGIDETMTTKDNTDKMDETIKEGSQELESLEKESMEYSEDNKLKATDQDDEISLSYSPDFEQEEIEIVDTFTGCFEVSEPVFIRTTSFDESWCEKYVNKSEEVMASISMLRNVNHKADVVDELASKVGTAEEDSDEEVWAKAIELPVVSGIPNLENVPTPEKVVKPSIQPVSQIPNLENVPTTTEAERVDVVSPARRPQLERTCKIPKSNSDNLETELSDIDLVHLFKDLGESNEEECNEDLNSQEEPSSQESSGKSLILYDNQIDRCRQSLLKAVKTQPQNKVYQPLTPENLNISEFTFIMQKIAELTLKKSENQAEIRVGGFRAVGFDDGMMFSCTLKIFNKLCNFETTVLSDFGKHVNLSHQNCYWDGVCASCFTIFKDPATHVKTYVNTQCIAFCHLVTMHLSFDSADGTFLSSIKEVASKPTPPRQLIRVRRLSGDLLSTPAPGVDNSLANTGTACNLMMSPPRENLPPGVPRIADRTTKIKLQEFFVTDLDSKVVSVHAQRLRRSKTRKALTNMLQRSKLRQFYKCMGFNCSFTAVHFKDFAVHYDQHKYIHNLNPAEDPHKGFWRMCAYCEEESNTNSELGVHLRLSHGECLYQCNLCFYRAKCISNVGYHHTLEHNGEGICILECEDLEKLVCEKPLERHFTHFAPALKCEKEKCSLATFMITRYCEHMLSVHHLDTHFKCFKCDRFCSDIVNLLQHIKKDHGIGMYQCQYCPYGSYPESGIKSHLCYRHPEQLPISIFRTQSPPPPNAKNPNLEVMKRHLYHTKKNVDYRKYLVPLLNKSQSDVAIKPVTPTKNDASDRPYPVGLISKSPLQRSSVLKEASSVKTVNPSPTTLLILQRRPPIKVPMSSDSVLAIAGSSTLSPSPRFLAVAGPSTSSPSPRFQAVAGSSTSSPSSRFLTVAGPSTSSPQAVAVSPPSRSIVSPCSHGEVILLESPEPATTTTPGSIAPSTGPSSDPFSNQVSGESQQTQGGEVNTPPAPVYENYFKCGNKDCDYDTASSVDLTNHLIMCDYARQSQRLICKYCKRSFKMIQPLINHLRLKHGPARFSCSMCDFKDPLKERVVSHQKTVHHVAHCIIVPRDINLTNGDRDYFTVIPKEKVPCLPKRRLKDRAKVAAPPKEKAKATAPPLPEEEEEVIPEPPITDKGFHCSQCDYTTKVRINLTYHENAHKRGDTVLLQDVVNPVPEKKEKMFDKMVNLAGSSHKKREEEEEDATCPFQYVTEALRFKCTVENCCYLSLSDWLLREHISVIHKDETSYTCPHCVEKPVSVPTDQVLMHLKLHDCPLFKCSHCKFYSHMRNSINRHQTLFHCDIPEEQMSVNIVRSARAEQAVRTPAPPPPAGPVAQQEEEVFQCTLCSFCAKTKKLILTHLIRQHKKDKPFHCPLCNQGTSTIQAFRSHFTAVHKKRPYLDPVCLYTSVKQMVKSISLPAINSPFRPGKTKGPTHIRGIPIDEAGDAPPPVLTGSREDDIRTLDKLELKFGKYGLPDNLGNLVCPRCPRYLTKKEQEMREHLFRDMEYLPYSCSICQFEGSTKKKLERHVLSHKIDPTEISNYIETKENLELEEWVHKVISTQMSQMKGGDSGEPTGRKRRTGSLEDSSLAKLKKTNTCEAIPSTSTSATARPSVITDETIPSTLTSATAWPSVITAADYVLDTDEETELSSDTLSQDGSWKPERVVTVDAEPSHKMQLRNRHQCNFCDSTTKFKTSLSLHQKICHPEKSTKFVEDPQEIKTEAFSCIYCNCLALYMHDLKTHWAVNHNNLKFKIKRKTVRNDLEYQCFVCKLSGNVFTLEEHFIVNHPDKSVMLIPSIVTKYKCSECKLVFNSTDILNKHFLLNHPNKVFSFQVVGSQKPFPTPCLESRVTSYKCFTCHFVSPEYRDMVKHVQRHFTTYLCPLCNIFCPTVQGIRSHMNSNHPGADTRPHILNGSRVDVENAKRNICVVCSDGKRRKITEEEIERGEREDDPRETETVSSHEVVKTKSPVTSPVRETARKSTGSPKKSPPNTGKTTSPSKLKVGLRRNAQKKKKKLTLRDLVVEVHSRRKRVKFPALVLERMMDLNARVCMQAVSSDGQKI